MIHSLAVHDGREHTVTLHASESAAIESLRENYGIDAPIEDTLHEARWHLGLNVSIEAHDQPSGDLATAVQDALHDRGDPCAAARTRQDDQRTWDTFIGPMLDAIQKHA